MFKNKSLVLFLFIVIFLPSCSEDSSLTGRWECSMLIMMNTDASATMTLKEQGGKLTGKFYWDELSLSLEGTVNSRRQVNMETTDSTHRCIFALRALEGNTFLDGSFSYYRNNIYVDSGSFEAYKK